MLKNLTPILKAVKNIFIVCFLLHNVFFISQMLVNNLFKQIKSRLHPMDVIRTIVSYIGESDKKSDLELTTQISAAVAYVIASSQEVRNTIS